ncbi:MAG TPA: hypothetical protein PLB14_09395 [Smithellaceae bacterium]|nr:hypothetical protein [Smithellaceae bacterium]HPL97753.1 hypothetical protein [Smithellaceae bacterium]HPV49912.1 hypothetical protein [Smithellaceae bacterium]HQF85106.1 hypothetical protein [Smithellaceae bacterium]HQG81278.1 hypothetical protein [Smithellaceae bacterium]
MQLLMGGAVISVLGLIGLLAWWSEFIDLLQGALPVFMLLGGALAIYVGFDEMHDKFRQERQRQSEELEKAREEIETARAEAGRYREELDRLKKDAQEAVPGIRK